MVAFHFLACQLLKTTLLLCFLLVSGLLSLAETVPSEKPSGFRVSSELRLLGRKELKVGSLWACDLLLLWALHRIMDCKESLSMTALGHRRSVALWPECQHSQQWDIRVAVCLGSDLLRKKQWNHVSVLQHLTPNSPLTHVSGKGMQSMLEFHRLYSLLEKKMSFRSSRKGSESLVQWEG